MFQGDYQPMQSCELVDPALRVIVVPGHEKHT